MEPLAYIGFYIRSNNTALLNAVFNMMPAREDSRLWSGQYNLTRGPDEIVFDGAEVVSASLYFNDFTERANFRSALGVINGFFNTALPGSYIIYSKSWDHNPNRTETDEPELKESMF
jgi:hypothetical protein